LEAPTNAAGDDTATRDDEHSDVECREMEKTAGMARRAERERERDEKDEKETQI
jgi:hypothetical protein